MEGELQHLWRFKDSAEYAQIHFPRLSKGAEATFTGNSVRVSNPDQHKETLFQILQLYSTIDADRSRIEHLPDGSGVLQLRKLVPGEPWPQATASDASSASDGHRQNPLVERQAVEQLLRAAQDGDAEAFSSAAQHFGDSDLSSVKDGNERNALHFAAASGQTEFCRYLLTERGFESDSQDSAGETALAFAAGAGDLTCMRALLELGANAATANSKGGPQAIHRAAHSGSMPAMELLMTEGADVNATSSAGPPLLWAAGEQQEDMVSFLLSHGADVNAVDEKNVNACLMAAATGCRRMLEELISSGANVNIAAHGGVTALHVAAESGHLGIVQTLLQAGADAEAKEQSGQRAIDVAAGARQREVVELLLPRTAPEEGREWSIDALMERAASAAHQDHQHSDCCGCAHEHPNVEEQVDIPEAEDPDDTKGKHLKRKGDEAFVKGNFKAATEAYTQALRHTTSDSAVWANRSAASLRTGAAQDALQDARCARTLKPGFAKAYYREGSALQTLGRWEEAAQAFFQGFRADPQNAALAQAFQKAVQKAREENAQAFSHA
ncbi:hypothetical protein CVIRNUC_005907 [Coccomyxa viridis]|uniref:CS domain-containing protein n=1 Tax=Coccomyxa viridis TaxID=1274662 RepID=A0AAV1I918_9CHLO|nr:hypothetical protein CVIRNUC_005907 [Coccomyxa viridis]